MKRLGLLGLLASGVAMLPAARAQRLAGPLDATRVVPLPGHVHPRARAEFDQGPVDPSTPIPHAVLGLKLTSSQQSDLEQLLAAQRNPASPDYHRWLTPDQFAARFGASPSDIDRTTAWLRSQGLLGRELIVIQPGNHRTMGPRRARWRRLNTDDKWWPLEHWAELLRRIHRERPDALLVLRGSKEEVPMLHEIRRVTNAAGVIVVGTTLRQLYALCQAAGSMVSVDSGPAHAAAALSVPLVVLYGAESPLYWLPRSPAGSPVAGVGGPPLSRRVDQLSVDAVFTAWRGITGNAAA